MSDKHNCEICECEIDHEGYCARCSEIFGFEPHTPSSCACPRCGGESDGPGELCRDCDERLDARPESRW